MECRFPSLAIVLCLAAMPALPGLAATPPAAPVLQLSGDDFPELLVRRQVFDESGDPRVRSCDQVRARRIDELDPLWKQAVDRIHLDCDELGEDEVGMDTIATTATAFLKPGKVHFAGLPLLEVRLMDSDLWSDHQYLVDRPYAEARAGLLAHIESRCQVQQDNPSLLVRHDCKVLVREDGLYLETHEAGGIWIHAGSDDPRHTIYAEAWAD